jgi:predicted esterase
VDESLQPFADELNMAFVGVSVTIQPGRVVLYGFSQGGTVAFQVAYSNPKEFRGAIPISPGGREYPEFDTLKPVADNKSQGYVCLCGGGEAPGNVLLTRQIAEVARKAGCRVELVIDPEQTTHSFPADFADTFAKRVRFIAGEK